MEYQVVEGEAKRSEPVRSRWTPKAEQILILESIFNSGMVNPPKDETIRIRKLLEKFGSVGDANVFYWFQNRRSRSRRKQRQIQASLQLTIPTTTTTTTTTTDQTQTQTFTIQASPCAATTFDHYDEPTSVACFASSPCCLVDSSSTSTLSFSTSQQQIGLPDIAQNSILCPPHISNLLYQSGRCITVFINGVAAEVPRGTFDITTMFGQDVILVHSSGVPVPINEYGFLLQSLQMGESYFLVSHKI